MFFILPLKGDPIFFTNFLQNMPFGISSPLACPILSLRFMSLRLLLHPYIHRKERKLTHCIPDLFSEALRVRNALQRLQRPLSFNMQYGRKRNSRLTNRPPQPPCCLESLNMWTDRSFTGLEKWFAVFVLTSRTFPSITPLCTIILC